MVGFFFVFLTIPKYNFFFLFSYNDKSDWVNAETNFINSNQGEWKVLSAKWPIFLAVGIALVLVGIIAAIMYKTKAYKKLRFFEAKIEEEKQEIAEIKRKSSLLLQRLSSMNPNEGDNFNSVNQERIGFIPAP